MGGTWDATNVVDAQVAVVITPMSLDHTQLLGDTTAEIAGEKAGIIKPGAIGRAGPAAARRRRGAAAPGGRGRARPSRAKAWSSASLCPARRRRRAAADPAGPRRRRTRSMFLPLHGAHQAHNAACALAAVEAFFGGGGSTAGRRSRSARRSRPRTRPAGSRRSSHLADRPPGRRAQPGRRRGARWRRWRRPSRSTQLVGVVAILGDKDVARVLELLEPVA